MPLNLLVCQVLDMPLNLLVCQVLDMPLNLLGKTYLLRAQAVYGVAALRRDVEALLSTSYSISPSTSSPVNLLSTYYSITPHL